MKKILALTILFIFSCTSSAQQEDKGNSNQFEVSKTDEEWKAELSEMKYYVLRKAGTEKPYSSPLNDVKQDGVFVCAACENPLYESKHKFESGTGWPSFDRAIEESLAYSSDRKLGYKRDEALCGKCGGHLGHIFNDGPRQTTGMRHCINGAALQFIPNEKK